MSDLLVCETCKKPKRIKWMTDALLSDCGPCRHKKEIDATKEEIRNGTIERRIKNLKNRRKTKGK